MDVTNLNAALRRSATDVAEDDKLDRVRFGAYYMSSSGYGMRTSAPLNVGHLDLDFCCNRQKLDLDPMLFFLLLSLTRLALSVRWRAKVEHA